MLSAESPADKERRRRRESSSQLAERCNNLPGLEKVTRKLAMKIGQMNASALPRFIGKTWKTLRLTKKLDGFLVAHNSVTGRIRGLSTMLAQVQ